MSARSFLKALLIAGGLVLLPEASSWAYTLEQVQAQLQSTPNLTALFTQERQLKSFAQPLRSQGRLLLSQEQGLLWLQEQPFVLRLQLTSDAMIQTGPDGQVQRIAAKDNPQFFELSSVLSALLRADFAAAGKLFDFTFEDKGDSWQLSLTPKASPLDKIFRSIELTGREFVEQVYLQDTQGDSTAITFSAQQALPELTEADRALFAQ